MRYILKYRSNTFLPPDVVDILETAKSDLLKLSREPDKAFILFDAMRGELISWFADNAEAEKESGHRTGCETIGCPYWNGHFCRDDDPKYDAICRFNDYWKNQGSES
jgi:hypothetical protein